MQYLYWIKFSLLAVEVLFLQLSQQHRSKPCPEPIFTLLAIRAIALCFFHPTVPLASSHQIYFKAPSRQKIWLFAKSFAEDYCKKFNLWCGVAASKYFAAGGDSSCVAAAAGEKAFCRNLGGSSLCLRLTRLSPKPLMRDICLLFFLPQQRKGIMMKWAAAVIQRDCL